MGKILIHTPGWPQEKAFICTWKLRLTYGTDRLTWEQAPEAQWLCTRGEFIVLQGIAVYYASWYLLVMKVLTSDTLCIRKVEGYAIGDTTRFWSCPIFESLHLTCCYQWRWSWNLWRRTSSRLGVSFLNGKMLKNSTYTLCSLLFVRNGLPNWTIFSNWSQNDLPITWRASANLSRWGE